MEIINLYPEALDWMGASDLRALLAEVGTKSPARNKKIENSKKKP